MHPDPDAPLGRGFYAADTRAVARALLGCVMRSRVGGVTVSGRVVETEAYPPGDSCNHAARGPTARNRSMFGPPGTLYVYQIYGLHHCSNVATESAGVGAAVLIRALEPLEGVSTMALRRGVHITPRDLCRGPGRLCVALAIDRSLDGIDTTAPEAVIQVLAGHPLADHAVVQSARVGVVGAPGDVSAPWRFSLRDSRYVSGR